MYFHNSIHYHKHLLAPVLPNSIIISIIPGPEIDINTPEPIVVKDDYFCKHMNSPSYLCVECFNSYGYRFSTNNGQFMDRSFNIFGNNHDRLFMAYEVMERPRFGSFKKGNLYLHKDVYPGEFKNHAMLRSRTVESHFPLYDVFYRCGICGEMSPDMRTLFYHLIWASWIIENYEVRHLGNT